jgi:signal transduction histidine kinase
MTRPRATADDDLRDEVRRLRACVRDLVALSALPAAWVGREPRDVAGSLLDVLLSTLRLDLAYARLYDPAGGPDLEAARADRRLDVIARAQEIGRTLSPWLTPEEPGVARSVPDPLGSGMLRIVCLPIGLHGERGVVVAASRRADFPTDVEQLLLGVAATQAAIVLQEALNLATVREADRLKAQLLLREQAARAEAEEERRVIETLHRLGGVLAAELDLQKLLQLLTDEATTLTGAQFGAYFYNAPDDQGESYLLYTLSGAPRAAFETFPAPRATALFAPTFRGEAIVRLDDVTCDPRYGRNPPYRGMPEGHLPVRSYLAVPVVSRSGEVLGGLFFGHGAPGVFTERHERLLASIASHAAVAIDNAQLYQQAQAAVRARDAFLARASHELRTPLTAAIGTVRLLKRALAGTLKEQPAELTAIAARNLDSMLALTNDLLDLAKLEAGEAEPNLEAVELTAVVERSVEVVAAQAREKGVAIGSRIPPELVATADRLKLEQILVNLLGNAVKFTSAGGEVAVEATAQDGGIVLRVCDTGQGLGSDDLERIFEPFVQAGTPAQQRGTGLGLAIVKRLVELHGGRVWAESQGPGRGCTFTVCLPQAPASERGA